MARTRYQASDRVIPVHELPAAALRAVLREGYSVTDLRGDLLAGVVVGVVALPLAMALAIAVGVPPQHGLYTAIVAGVVVAALGGSRMQVTGPTAAFVVILAPIYTRFGMGGLLVSGILGGLMLIMMGLARFGKFIEFIPHPVTTGFTAGIATVIATLQLKDLFGLTLAHTPEHFLERVAAMFEARGTFAWRELVVGLATLGLLVYLPRWVKRVPSPLVALPVMTLLTVALHALVPAFAIATVDSRFHGIPQVPPLPVWPWAQGGPGGQPFHLSLEAIRALFSGAFAIAMLGAIESLLSAVVADGMARTKHDPDAELLALGIGNVVAPFFGGIPATGAIARTATNVRSGARSPVSSIVHALTILIAVLLLAPLLGYLPMAAMAALLLRVAWHMSEPKHFLHTLRVAPRSDVAVLMTCYGLTVLFDMVVGVSVGMVLAALLFMRRMAAVTTTRLLTGDNPDLPGPVPPGVLVYEVWGPLFFGAAQKAMAHLNVVGTRAKALILMMDGVQVMDATGLVALESALDQLKQNQCVAILSGVRPDPMSLLLKAHLDRRDGVILCTDGKAALEAAHRIVDQGTPPTVSEPLVPG